MKRPSYFLLILSFVFCLNTIFAQDSEVLRDSIHYTGNEKLDLLILVKDYHDLTKNELLKELLLDFQSNLEKIQEDVPTDSPYIVEYQYKQKVEIRQSSIIKSYKMAGQNSLVENFKNQAIISEPSKNVQITISFNELGDLKSINLTSLLEGIIRELPGKDRYLRFLEYQTDAGSSKIKLIQNRPSGYLDMLSFKAGVGANVYQNKFLTDITGEIGLHLNQKGILKNQIYVSNNLLFSFSAQNRPIINNFTNVGYRRNLSHQKENPNWLGVEFGLLTKQKGDVFRTNTMRLGVNWDAGKNINVSPQLYFNGFFQQVSPGLRIGIGL